MVGEGAVVGIGSVPMPGACIGKYAVVAPGAVVPPGTNIPAHEMWGGIPARKIKELGHGIPGIAGVEAEADGSAIPEPHALGSPVRVCAGFAINESR